METQIGLSHFLAQTDGVSRGILLALLGMSLASWTLIATRLAAAWSDRGGREARGRIAAQAAAARARGNAEALGRALRRALDAELVRRESGLTLLASVGATAPFVGLFGTVWGVYHALVSIGLSGQGTLDKVAGPVGEALIMTALGLAVAIPAVLAYNGFVRANRVALAGLDAHAHDLYDELAGEKA